MSSNHANRLTDQQRAAIVVDIQAATMGRNAIARKHRVGLGTVSKIARDAGLHNAFDRSQTAQATSDRQADMAARRLEIAESLLDDIEDIKAQFFDAYTWVGSSKDGVVKTTLPRPDATALRNLATSVAVLVDKHLALVRHDAGQNHEGAKTMLGALADGLRELHDLSRQLPDTDPGQG